MNKTNFFEHYYNNAVVNSIAIISTDGIILEINKGFTNNFGYTNQDLQGKNFEELFTPIDREDNKPAIELQKVLSSGQANDDGFLLNKTGSPVWCSGEIMLAYDADGTKILIKDVINLQARKHLNLFLKNTDLLDRIFHASKDIPMMIVDGSIKILDINEAFIRFFDIEKLPGKGVNLSQLNNAFWSSSKIKKDLSQVLVTNNPLSAKKYCYKPLNGVVKSILIDTKTVFSQPDQSRRIFVIIEELQEQISIHFDHLGENQSAKFSFNSKATKESITMQFDNNFNDDIIFSNVNGMWTSISDMQSRYPPTYHNIQESLSNYFYRLEED